MILAHGAMCGLTEFSEIDQICIVHDNMFYIVKKLCGWYREHYRAFELSTAPTRTFSLVTLSELSDIYPLIDYKIGSSRMVTLKRHIIIKGGIVVNNLVMLYFAFDFLLSFFFLNGLRHCRAIIV